MQAHLYYNTPITNLQATDYTVHIHNTHTCNNMPVTKIYRAVIGTVRLNNTRLQEYSQNYRTAGQLFRLCI